MKALHIALALIVLLALADLPTEAYTVVRFVVCAGAVLLAFKTRLRSWQWTWTAVAVVFNPVASFHFARDVWRSVDIAAFAIACSSLVSHVRQQRECGDRVPDGHEALGSCAMPSRNAQERKDVRRALVWVGVMSGLTLICVILRPLVVFAVLFGLSMIFCIWDACRQYSYIIREERGMLVVYSKRGRLEYAVGDIRAIRVGRTRWIRNGVPAELEETYRVVLSSGATVIFANRGDNAGAVFHWGPIAIGGDALRLGESLFRAHTDIRYAQDIAILRSGGRVSYGYRRSSAIELTADRLSVAGRNVALGDVESVTFEDGKIVFKGRDPLWPNWAGKSVYKQVPVASVDDAIVAVAVIAQALSERAARS